MLAERRAARNGCARYVPGGTVCLWACLALLAGCSEDPPGPGFEPGKNCGFEEDDPFVFSSVELLEDASSSGCFEVSAEQVNGAKRPDCERALDGCELVVRCTLDLDGAGLTGSGRLSAVDAGQQLAGVVRVNLGGADCFYDVLATLE